LRLKKGCASGKNFPTLGLAKTPSPILFKGLESIFCAKTYVFELLMPREIIEVVEN
jgi:hypothetical protein